MQIDQLRVQIDQFRVQIDHLRVQIDQLRVQIDQLGVSVARASGPRVILLGPSALAKGRVGPCERALPVGFYSLLPTLKLLADRSLVRG